MLKKKSRITRTRQAPPPSEPMAFAILFVLVMGVIVLGVFQYTALLVAGSAIFVGFFGWLWWKRRGATAATTTKKAAARGKRKARTR